MSLLRLRQLSKLCLGKQSLVRSSLLLLSNGFSSSSLQTPPCFIISVKYCEEYRCGEEIGNLVIHNANEVPCTTLEKKVPVELVDSDPMVTIGASHGWVATLKEDGILRLQDDFNPVASDTNPKRIPLPPLVTLPHCQTRIVTNVAMSSASPEDEDCVVAVKFLGPQLSFCRPAQPNSEWTNIRIQNSCFFSSPITFSKKHDMFRILGSGGHLIASWDLYKHLDEPKFQRLQYQNFRKLTKAKQELLLSCCTSEHLVESPSTGETFLVKLYRKTIPSSTVKLKTRGIMVFKLNEEEGNAVYTEDIGDLSIFLSKSEPFCVPASSFDIYPNGVTFYDVDELCIVHLADCWINSRNFPSVPLSPYHIPPQNI